jgi:H+-translocating NAD(P) transhydrogenase subunit alpha
VTIVGYTDLASRMARQSSTLYGTNLFRLTEELCKTKDGVINVNMEDDAIRGLTVIKDGEITWPAPPLAPAAPKPAAKPAAAAAKKKGGHGHGSSGPLPAKTLAIVFGIGALAFWPSVPTRRRPSWGTSRCSCWPASSATWWSGT